jgi:signal transduction histidine kinase
MNALLLELRPSLLEERGLLPVLDELCGTYHSRLGVTISADLEPVNLPPPAEHAVFRAAQEGLSNAVRHAPARTISLSLRQRGDTAELRVADDGRGLTRRPEQPVRASVSPSCGSGRPIWAARLP